MMQMGRVGAMAIGGIGFALLLVGLGTVPTKAEPPAAVPGGEAAGDQSPAVASARERAQTLHAVYAATLEAMHEHYFHGERAMVPARALEDVFAEMAREQKIEARWISVNTKPMSINHEPKSDFELQAAAALGKGAKEYERVDKDVYLRAGVIQLADSCVACHTGFFATPPKTPRVAGLVIRVPLKRN